MVAAFVLVLTPSVLLLLLENPVQSVIPHSHRYPSVTDHDRCRPLSRGDGAGMEPSGPAESQAPSSTELVTTRRVAAVSGNGDWGSLAPYKADLSCAL